MSIVDFACVGSLPCDGRCGEVAGVCPRSRKSLHSFEPIPSNPSLSLGFEEYTNKGESQKLATKYSVFSCSYYSYFL